MKDVDVSTHTLSALGGWRKKDCYPYVSAKFTPQNCYYIGDWMCLGKFWIKWSATAIRCLAIRSTVTSVLVLKLPSLLTRE